MSFNANDEIERSAKILVDTMVDYNLVAETCLAKLRTFHKPTVKGLWADTQKIFMGDPIKYPSAMPPRNDPVAREQFRSKCKAFCSLLSSNLPATPEDDLMIFFVAMAGMQYTLEIDMDEHPHGSRLGSIANREMNKKLSILTATKEYKCLTADDPINLIDMEISCRDKGSDLITHYTVADYLGSTVGADSYFVLVDDEGQKKFVTVEDSNTTPSSDSISNSASSSDSISASAFGNDSASGRTSTSSVRLASSTPISDFRSWNSVGNQATRVIGGIKGRSRVREVRGMQG
ncbi:hypothetical protein JB92DRAFT_3110019 [Gautieria morchelliformis]|nr:hypothetical protein JB92DRAFT_3110019 [Gautieria morchelliformis]